MIAISLARTSVAVDVGRISYIFDQDETLNNAVEHPTSVHKFDMLDTTSALISKWPVPLAGFNAASL